MRKMNELLHFSHQFESGYSIVRRLAIANGIVRYLKPIDGLKQCENYFKRRLKPSNAGCKTTLYKFIGDYPQAPFEIMPTMLTGSPSVKKQCPECARMLFHTHLYDANWLQFCPLHKCELLSHCPDCGSEWSLKSSLNRLSSEHKRPCQTCGLTGFSNYIERRQMAAQGLTGALAPYQQILSNFYARNRFSMAFRESGNSNKPTRSSRECLEGSDIEVPTLMAHLDASLSLDELTLVPCSTKYCTPIPIARLAERNSKITRYASPTIDSSDRWLVWLDVLKLIVANVRINCSPNHELHASSFIPKGDGPCPYCFAFGDWIRSGLYEFLGQPFRSYRYKPEHVVNSVIDCEAREFSVPESLQREILFTDFLHYFVRLLRRYLVAKEFCFESPIADFSTSMSECVAQNRDIFRTFKPGKYFFVDQCPGEVDVSVWRITSPLVEWEDISNLCNPQSLICKQPYFYSNSFADVIHEGKPLGFKGLYPFGKVVELSQWMALSIDQ